MTTEKGIGHFDAFGLDDGTLRRVLDSAMGRGGEFADLFFQHKTSRSLGLEDGEVNQAYSSVQLGCGVRVVKGDQCGFAFTEDLSERALADAAKVAAMVADDAAASEMGPFHLASPAQHYGIELPWSDVGIERKVPLLEIANRRAMAFDPRIIKVRVFFTDTESHILVARSDGLLAGDFQPMVVAIVTVVAEEGDRREENHASVGQRRGFEFTTEMLMAELAERAARKTTVLFDSTTPPAGEYPVVLAPGVSGVLLHEAMGHGFEADFNRKGISVFADRIGEKVAPDFVTIVDDGTNEHGRGTINIDDEGNESRVTVLVEDGVLAGYMHDRISSNHYGVEPTGNGRRQSYRFPPVPRMRNTYMVDGPHDPEEIISSVKKGVYCESFTNGQVQIGSGDFSFYLKNGFLIEDGKLTRPVKDANLIGFGPDVLEKVEMAGNDLEMKYGAGRCGKDGQGVPVGFGQPTLLCGGISVGGGG